MIVSSEFIRGYSEIIIMAILSKKDSYAYEIVSLIEEASKGQVVITNPSVIVILRKMLEEGKVSTYEKANKKNVKRKYYKLTFKGRQEYLNVKDKYLETLVSLKKLIEGDFNTNEEED